MSVPAVPPITTFAIARPRSCGGCTSAATNRERALAALAGPINARPIRNPRNVRATIAHAAITAPTTPIAKPVPSAPRRPKRSIPYPSTNDAAATPRLKTEPGTPAHSSAAAEIGTDNGGDRGRGEKAGRAQGLRDEQRPRDFSRDVHDVENISTRTLTALSMFQRRDAKTQSFELYVRSVRL